MWSLTQRNIVESTIHCLFCFTLKVKIVCYSRKYFLKSKKCCINPLSRKNALPIRTVKLLSGYWMPLCTRQSGCFRCDAALSFSLFTYCHPAKHTWTISQYIELSHWEPVCENELAQLEMSKFKVNYINKYKAQYLKQSINPKDHENQLLYYVNDEFQIKGSFNVRTKKEN